MIRLILITPPNNICPSNKTSHLEFFICHIDFKNLIYVTIGTKCVVTDDYFPQYSKTRIMNKIKLTDVNELYGILMYLTDKGMLYNFFVVVDKLNF